MTKPIAFADTPGPAPTASPTFGQHSDEILADFGYRPAEIAALRSRGVVR
jgi:crotonobetainyl-CoA:carnitine CoA-transferase CaiB-like acyl-CoA transferase